MLQDDGWRSIEELVVYGREPVACVFDPEVVGRADFIDTDFLETLAYKTGGNSRLYRDPAVPGMVADSERFRAILDQVDSGNVLFAFDDVSLPAGLITWEEEGASARIGTIAVLPEQSGRGLGSELLKAWMSMMAGKKIVFAGTQSHNPARSLYEGHGFKRIGTEWTFHK